jgi:hypothetical protein
MKLKIIQIIDRGVPQKERLHMSVLADANLTNYAVIDTARVESTKIAAGSRRVYWFFDKKVRAGDSVILFSGPGTNISQPRADGANNHFYYWGFKETIWGDPLSCAVLLELNSWETSPA